jgi:hypothetical protein
MKYLKKLTDYLNLVRQYIQNYAMRDCLGLRNSCGPVERPTTWWWPNGKNMTGWLGQKKARWV